MRILVLFVIQLCVSQHAVALKVREGAESIVLPCSFINPELEKSAVVWSRKDLNPSIVLVHENGRDDFQGQNQLYRDRTSMNADAQKTGDLSLTLRKLTLLDESTYTCSVRNFGETLYQTEILLNVERDGVPTWITVFLVITVAVLAVIVGIVFRFRNFLRKVPEVVVTTGVKSVCLPCITIVPLPYNAKVEWTVGKDRTVHVYENDSDQPDKQHWLYKNRTKMKQSLKLKILNVLLLELKHPTDKDNCTYFCCVYNKHGEVLMKKSVQLRVKVPEIVLDADEESVKLPCKSTVPLSRDMTIEWSFSHIWVTKVCVFKKASEKPEELNELYRNRTKMEQNPMETENLTLTLKDPTDRDNHFYTCTVYNKNGDILMKKQVKLTVKVCQVEVEEGEKFVELPFKTVGDLSNAEVTWWRYEPEPPMTVYKCLKDEEEQLDKFYKDRIKMHKETGNFSLTLMYPTDRDTGQYICTVTNHKNKRKKNVELKVINREVEVIAGEMSVELPFQTTPDLPVDSKVVWKRIHPEPELDVLFYQNSIKQQDELYKDRTEMKEDFLKNGDLSLTLRLPTVRDMGKYICRVCSKDKNICRETSVMLEVKEKSHEDDNGTRSTINSTELLIGDQSV